MAVTRHLSIMVQLVANSLATVQNAAGVFFSSLCKTSCRSSIVWVGLPLYFATFCKTSSAFFSRPDAQSQSGVSSMSLCTELQLHEIKVVESTHWEGGNVIARFLVFFFAFVNNWEFRSFVVREVRVLLLLIITEKVLVIVGVLSYHKLWWSQ